MAALKSPLTLRFGPKDIRRLPIVEAASRRVTRGVVRIHLAHTPNHVACPACNARTMRRLQPELCTPAMRFPDAAKVWFANHGRELKTGTLETYRAYEWALTKFFQGLRLSEISIGHIETYQMFRTNNEGELWAKTAGASVVNHELNLLSQMLREAGLWGALVDHYRPLEIQKSIARRVMQESEVERFYRVAERSTRFELAYIVAGITNHTTASGIELRMLRLQDVKLEAKTPYVLVEGDHLKEDQRNRIIPLNEVAVHHFKLAIKRARRLGSVEPHHYLFPFRIHRGKFDPERPAGESWLKKQWQGLRKETGLEWLVPHHMRHQAVTELIERDNPEQVVIALAGWGSREMLDHYSHARLGAKKKAVQSIVEAHPLTVMPYTLLGHAAYSDAPGLVR